MLIAILAIVTIAVALALYAGLTATPVLDDLVDLRRPPDTEDLEDESREAG
ncbi:hypothetical protein EV644_106158 [Kribbella orskensis]|uniref:Methionine/alanine importer small subunit n=1 Tax=Kribbella orskensis TaxID=2512216 RepID=A0ABY2BJR1_9ACTN|nr:MULTISPECIES: hypothetical protein [Kribbella]TCN40230.1 hypothetical protein EV642_105158 [Kribbella sp. VKM Ac-2500]TCO22850.1 hypothetical protein EV644_106158 [Kribbella orskensis]